MGLGWDGILDPAVVQGSYDLIGLWPLFYGEKLSVISIKLWHRIIIPTEVPAHLSMRCQAFDTPFHTESNA